MKTRKLFLGLALSLTILSCSKDDNNTSSTEMSTAKKTATANNQIDAVSNDISDITDNQMMLMGASPTGKSGTADTPFLPDCVTTNPSHPDANTWENTLTFNNCQLQNGNVINGTISFEAVKSTDNLTITYIFTKFSHNGTLVEGKRTVVKSIKSTDTLQSLHPVDNITMDMTFTFADSSTYHVVGTKTREMIAGFDTPYFWHDDVFSITGNWASDSSANGSCATTITTPLIRKMDCHNIVSGVISIVKNNKTITLDYGNGNCDNTATITVDGKTETITIGKN